MKDKLAELGRRLMALFHRGQFDASLEEEMRLHQELREQEQVERGLSPEEARYAAQRRFGNKLVLREESRDMWGWNWLETLLHDIRYGLRQLRRNSGFTAVTVIMLALGIGANTAIFTLVDAVILKSLPVVNPKQLYRLGDRNDCCVNGGFEDLGWDLFPYSLYVISRPSAPLSFADERSPSKTLQLLPVSP
jgi:hypothetical protein